MRKNVTKLLALQLAVLSAFSATGAGSAQAVLFHKTNMGKTVISGGQVTQNVFTIPEGTVKCNTANFTAETEETTPATLTVAPTYSGCEFANLGKNTATVTMNGCDFVLHANGEADIECAGAGPITVDVAVATVKKCTITIPQQTGLKSLLYTNDAGGTLEWSFNLASIAYATSAGTGAGSCSTTSPTVGGTYVGSARVTGAIGGVPERIWVE